MVVYGVSVIVSVLCLVTCLINVIIALLRRNIRTHNQSSLVRLLKNVSLILAGVVILIMLFIAVTTPSVLENELMNLLQPTLLALISVAISFLVIKTVNHNSDQK